MKFKAKPREVTVGILKPNLQYGTAAQIAVIDLATRRADVIPLDDFIERFEAADEDAKMMLEGLKSRPKPPSPFDPPPIPEDDFDGFEISDSEGGSRLRMTPIKKKKGPKH